MDIYVNTGVWLANRSIGVVNSKPASDGAALTAQTLNPQNVREDIDMLSQAGKCAPIPVLGILAAYSGDFQHSNALHCVALAGVGYNRGVAHCGPHMVTTGWKD